MRVLQVEDNAATAKSVELMLKAQGHACETAECGEDALRLVREKDYDLILLDIMLPDIDGYEVLKRIAGWNIQTPVLIQSGLVGNEVDRAALGMLDSLAKPYGSKELQQRIAAIAERQGQTDGGVGKAGGAKEKSASERRGAQRTRTIKGGMIVYNQNKCDMECLILSLSEAGAALQPQDMLNLPDSFLLKIKDGAVHECQVCWRHANKLGVRFADA
jgi:DNA-binding response OmpR family regulator